MLLDRIHNHIPLICYLTVSNNTTNISCRTALSEVLLQRKLSRNAQIKAYMKPWVFEILNVVFSFINRNAFYGEQRCLPVSVMRWNSVVINNSSSFLAQSKYIFTATHHYSHKNGVE